MSFIGTAVIGAGVLGAGATIYGANKAADAQTNAANQAAQIQKDQFNTTNTNLAPYRDIGNVAAGQLTNRLSDLTSPISVNPQDFINSDQYKFLETQGQREVTNSSAARGLATSGAALKGAAAFETGLNSTQWQSNFNNQVTNQTNAYNRLKGLVDTGASAATGTGVLGEKAAYNEGTAVVGAGTAQAAADNATGKALSGLASNTSGYALAKGIYGSPGSGANVGGSGVANYNSGNPIY